MKTTTTKPSEIAIRALDAAWNAMQQIGHSMPDWPDTQHAARAIDAEIRPLMDALERIAKTTDVRAETVTPAWIRALRDIARAALANARIGGAAR